MGSTLIFGLLEVCDAAGGTGFIGLVKLLHLEIEWWF